MTKKMTKTLTIKGDELKKVLDRLVMDGDTFELEVDSFWEINDDEVYNIEESPKNFSIGQVTEEWEMLNKSLEDEDYYPLNTDLRNLGRILKAIGDTVDQSKTNEQRD
tara:strand:+ start:438 stop:761 length:324 start_codon:yes stop_codon:yes gene_type:complete